MGKKCNHWTCGGSGSALYCLGIIGSAIYFWTHSVGITAKAIALVKALVWPAILVYDILKFLHG